MLNPIVPYQQALAELQPLSTMLYDAFPEVREVIIPYFRKREHPVDIDRVLFPHMVRSELKKILTARGIEVEEDGPEVQGQAVEVEMTSVPQNGLFGSYANYRFRILKADNGQLPVAGSSKPRQEFYAQQGYLLDFKSESDLRPNVVFLWDFDPNYRSVRLMLACPKQGGKTRSSVKAYWSEPIPHPVEMVEATFRQDATEPQIGAKETISTAH